MLYWRKKTENSGKKIQWLRTNKANNTNKVNKLETQVKNLQKSLTEANRKNAKKKQTTQIYT